MYGGAGSADAAGEMTRHLSRGLGMKVDIRNNKDFFAGLYLILTGAVAMVIALDYPMGSAVRMGPGYFPTVLGGIMILFGLYVMSMGIKSREKIQGNWSLRALVVLSVTMVVFGYMMEHVGFIPALVVLIFGSATAGRQFKFVEITLLTIGLTVGSVALFIYGLGLPYPLIKGLWGY